MKFILYACIIFIINIQLTNGQIGCGRINQWYRAVHSDLIIGGQDATSGAWPSMAVISYRGYKLCGAAIVRIPGQPAHWLVTAAHCLAKIRKKDKAKIVVGVTKKSDRGITYTIQRMIPHPQYYRSRDCRKHGPAFDIALIKVRSPISMRPGKVEWACLPREQDLKILRDPGQIKGLMCHAIGFGIYKEGYRKPANALQQLRVDKFNECSDLYPACYTRYQICWGEKGRQSCVGDSGAPLLCAVNGRWTVAGVSSRVMGRRCDEGAIYVNMADMADWVRQTTKE